MIEPACIQQRCTIWKAIDAIGTDEAPKVMAQMRATPVSDFFAKNGKIRIDGRMVPDMYLFEVKKPSESKNEWIYKLIATVPGDEAFRPLGEGGCPPGDALSLRANRKVGKVKRAHKSLLMRWWARRRYAFARTLRIYAVRGSNSRT